MDYSPPTLDQPVFFYYPAEAGALAEASGHHLSKDLGWKSVVSRLTLREVPGNHFSMMSGANGRSLARLVAEHLE
jgi:thioesterase domain-containing protein